MKDRQKIKIVTTQYSDDDKETIIVNTDAAISGNKDDYTIAYTETQGDTAGEETVIRVRNSKKLSISRKNALVSSLIILEKNVRHVTHYSNSGLNFNMGMSCSEMISDFEGGRLYFRYETDMDMVSIGEIEFEFNFRKTEV